LFEDSDSDEFVSENRFLQDQLDELD